MTFDNRYKTFLASTAVVIVLYNQTLKGSEIFESLQKAHGDLNVTLDLIVYDNSPESCPTPSTLGFNIRYFHNPDNPGISTAYNVAAKCATETMHKKWLLIFDQDTMIGEDTLSKYASSIHEYPKIKLFAPILVNQFGSVISPCKFKFRMGSPAGKITYGIHALRLLSPVNSGICVELDLFHKVGGYNQLIPLDYSDFDFIERLQEYISDFFVLDLCFTHNLSSSEKQNLNAALTRFRFLCIGLRNSSKDTKSRIFSFFVGLKRALKLTAVHRNSSFVRMLFNEFE